MDYLKQFSIPFKGMLDGIHNYSFEVNEVFFNRFPDSQINQAEIVAEFKTDKQGAIMTVELDINGRVKLPCDRCLSEIFIPISESYQLILKMASETAEDPDLYYLDPNETEWNVAELIYEYSCLSIPYSKLTDCQNMTPVPCNQDVLNKLWTDQEITEQNPIWDELKNLNLK